MSAADQSLPGAVIEAAVDAVAPGGQALRQLADALAADPGALAAGASPVAGRLAAELIARGSATLAVPACTVCGRAGKPLFRGDGGGVCQRCRAWQVARPCASFGKVKPAAGSDEDGKAVCEVCRRRDDPRRHRECGTCGNTAPVAVRGRDGQPGICTGCYQLPEATCSTCQRRRSRAWAATSQPICRSCSPRATAACARCGHDRPRRPAGRKDRFATRATARPCSTAASAHPAASSGGWSPRLARPLTRARTARGSRSPLLRGLRNRRQALRERPLRPVQPAPPGPRAAVRRPAPGSSP